MGSKEGEAFGSEKSDDLPRDLTAFQQNLLVVLSEEPSYGLAIKRELEAYYGEDVNHGRLYPNLDDLVTMGLVEKSALDKRTNQYALTDDGFAVLEDQLDWTLTMAMHGDASSAVRDVVEEYY